MKKTLVFLGLILVSFLFSAHSTLAQCAMCRATVETHISTGEDRIGLGLNTGILYLMVTPYIVLSVIGYLWYRQSKKEHEQKLRIRSIVESKMSQMP
jgi:hypothetical protein